MSLSICQPCRHVEIPVFLRVTFSYWIDSSCPLFQLHYKVLVLKKLIDLTKGERNDDNNGH